VTLEAGDVVIIGTDGIWEAANGDDEMFGKQRLCDLLLDCAEMPARGIYDAVVRAVEEFRGGAPQKDDLTLVVIKAL
jgi:sigma-B regulation protein RsbU (phosphoserine phosphatase)